MATNKFMPPKGKTWKRAFKDCGKKIPIEVNGVEIKMIIAGLLHFDEYLIKQSRFENSKEVKKLLEDFRSFDSFIVDNS